MTVVVVSGSNFDARIAVTNFVSATDAPTIFVNTGFPPIGPYQGCVVAGSSLYTDGDVTGSLVAVGQYGGDQVLIYDVSNPIAPTVQNSFSTGLGAGTGIGCISLYGNYLIAGELSGPTIVLLDISQTSAPIVSSLNCPEFADGGVTSIAICGDNGLMAAAAGPYGFDLLNYANISAPTRQGYVGNILGPFVCDFDGSNIAIGDGSGNTWLFPVSNGLFTDPFGPLATGQQAVTSIAVMSGDSVQVAAGFIGAPEVALVTFESGTPGPPPGNSIFLGQNPGNAGGALRFYGLANLLASTSDGLGVTWYNVMIWPSASPYSVASGANLNPGSAPTLAIAAFPAPIRFPFPWPWPWPWWRFWNGWLRGFLGG
jgi:hypothetical protein